HPRIERFTAGAANLCRTSHQRSRFARVLLGRVTFGISRHPCHRAHSCRFKDPPSNEPRRRFLERLLVCTQAPQPILYSRTKDGPRFCGCCAEITKSCLSCREAKDL